jgi:hypothetical protein|tara:strand:+ start:505 stop:708 length:204 start_codon:yes stop_codon:yes gene_type:complete
MQYKVILSDKESKQGLQLYDVLLNNKCVITYSLKQLNKYIDIYEVDKNGFIFIDNTTFKAIQREVKK